MKIPKYLQWLHNSSQTCIICGSESIELHHYKDKAHRSRDDRLIITLCPEHHRGSLLSPHGTPAKFRDALPHALEIAAEKFAEYEKGLDI